MESPLPETARPSSPSHVTALRIAAAAVIVAFIGHLVRFSDYTLDDTFISLRYARHWAEGLGVVFNPGERVEGYTNFLTVALAALMFTAGLDPVAWLPRMSLGLALVTVWFVRRLERCWPRPKDEQAWPTAWPGLAGLTLLAAQPFAYWAGSGMETMLFTTGLTAAVSFALREHLSGRGWRSAVIFLLLALTRPEGVALAGIVYGLLLGLSRPSAGSLRRAYGIKFASLLLPYGGYFAWRYSYYGHPFPNTFYAKVAGNEDKLSSGIASLTSFALAFPLLTAALVLALPIARRRLRSGSEAPERRLPLLTLCGLLLVYLAYVVLVGGDNLPCFRFYLPVLPGFAVLAAWVMREHGLSFAPGSRPALGLGFVALVAVTAVAPLFSGEVEKTFVAHRIAEVGRQVGLRLGAQVRPGDLVATNTAGTLPYYSRLPVVDMLGLVDETIAHRPLSPAARGWKAHRRGWGEYVLKRRPRIILWSNSAGSDRPRYLSDRELADQPYFRFFYSHHTALLSEPGDGQTAKEPIASFVGRFFGDSPTGRAVFSNLGVKAEFRRGMVARTVFYPGPVTVHTFRLEDRLEPLWPLALQHWRDPSAFVDAVTARWQEEIGNQAAPIAPDVLREVELICHQALAQFQLGRGDLARLVLSQAMAKTRFPALALPYQYLANIAALEGDLWTAVTAQREALRLEPGNRLARSNLKALLALPYEDFSRRNRQSGGGQTGAGQAE